MEITSGTYVTNSSYEVKIGTRYIQVTLDFPYTESNALRRAHTSAAIIAAVEEYEKKWGQLSWDYTSFQVEHVSCQVLVELRNDE